MGLARYFVGCVVVVNYFAKIDGGHNAVLFGIHAYAVYLFYVENCYVEGVLLGDVNARATHDALTDGVVLELQRAVKLAVLVVIIYATEVTQKTVNSTDEVALKVGLDQRCGEGIVNVFMLFVECDALNVTGFPSAAVNRQGKLDIVSHNCLQMFI